MLQRAARVQYGLLDVQEHRVRESWKLQLRFEAFNVFNVRTTMCRRRCTVKLKRDADRGQRKAHHESRAGDGRPRQFQLD
jgi:hypothetical protein